MARRRTMKMRPLVFLTVLSFLLIGLAGGLRAQQQDTGPAARRVIIFVWDGLRTDDLTPEITPNYFALARSGVVFADHHAVYPTFTMMNSASIATGTYPAGHGFYGNVVYAPLARGKNAKGADIDFSAPAFIPIRRLMDGQTANPLDRTGALSRRGFAYLTDVFVNYSLPNKKPHLTIFWSKEPDATSHAYGPGTYNSIDATKMNDEILGQVVEKLRQLGWDKSTDIIITQDHNHSTVSGDVAHYPLRAIVDGEIGAHDSHGYSVSGFVRTAELLTRDGLKAYDGAGCRDIPILSGITADGTHLYPSKEDQHGHVCGRAQKYTSPSYVVPKPIPAGAIVVAANAGSDYLFVPDGNLDTVKAAVTSLQSRLQFGAIFVSDKHGEIAGTLPMSLIKTESSGNGRAPDIIVSFNYDENVAVAGKSGVSYASSVNRRGDHGSFSPTDTHISLMASGPDFKSGFDDTLPTANVDIAPTIGRILQFTLPNAQGRVLEEALQGGVSLDEYAVLRMTHRSEVHTGLMMKLPTDLGWPVLTIPI